MKNRMVIVAGLAVSASAAVAVPPVIDGVKDASYGPAQWINSANPTQFGDNNYAPPPPCPHRRPSGYISISRARSAGLAG